MKTVIYILFDSKTGDSTRIQPRATTLSMLYVDGFFHANFMLSKITFAYGLKRL